MSDAPTPSTPADTLQLFGAAYIRTSQLLSDTAEAQWQMGATPQPKQDTTERSKGTTMDPVPTIAMDGRRLALRASVIEAEDAVESAHRAMVKAERILSKALRAAQGS